VINIGFTMESEAHERGHVPLGDRTEHDIMRGEVFLEPVRFQANSVAAFPQSCPSQHPFLRPKEPCGLK
jgi:hypothetical protein